MAIVIGRTLILALMIVTLADPQTTGEESHSQERIFAYDVSRSIPPSMREWMKTTRAAPTPTSNDRVFLFGSAPIASSNGRELLDDAAQSRSAGADPDKPNLENLLNSVLQLPPATRDLYLFTD
ncbi:MAG: hypothetical protein ACTHLX_17830, partial [Candidatus Binatia bacterium]